MMYPATGDSRSRDLSMQSDSHDKFTIYLNCYPLAVFLLDCGKTLRYTRTVLL